MDEPHAQKRPWDQRSEQDEIVARTRRHQSQPVPTSNMLMQEDITSHLSSKKPQLPSIAAALDGAESHIWDVPLTAASVDSVSAYNRYSPRDMSPKRPRISYDPYIGNYDHTEPNEFSQFPKDGTYLRSEGTNRQRPPTGSSHTADVAPCHRCSNLDDKVEDIVAGLLELEENLRRILAVPSHHAWSTKDNEFRPTVADVCSNGLERSLEWSVSRVGVHLKRTRDHPMVPRVHSPSSSPPHGVSASNHDFSSATSTMPRNEEHRQQYYPYQSFSQVSPSPRDTASPWITSFAAPPRPPEPLSPSTYPGSAGQILPSPTSGLYLTSPTSSKLPVEPSHSPPQHATSFVTNIARTTHLQDLQHEVSKKTLALTTLRKEHEALLAAYGRQQTRCTTLEKKTRVSDNEINDLTEERIRLQTQVEMLESQVEDLIRVREEAHKQSVANSAQYMQIMTMSSKLQAQGAEEARMWKLEREQWEKEKSVFIKKIADLESKAVSGDAIRDTGGISRIGLDYTNVEVPPSSPPADLSTSVTCTSTDPLGLLQFENADLKRTIETLEAKIQQMSTEAEEIDRAMNSMMRIRRRLTDITEPCASHADSTLQLAGASVSLENRDVP